VITVSLVRAQISEGDWLKHIDIFYMALLMAGGINQFPHITHAS